MRDTFKTLVKKILLLPQVKEKFRKVSQFYKEHFYEEIKAGQPEYMLDILDIRENFIDREGEALMAVAKQVLKEGMQVVEVGSWKGHSTYFLGKVVADMKGKVFAIDHWEGSENVSIHECAKEIDIFAIFKHNMEMLGMNNIVSPLKMDSLAAAKKFEPGTLDLVFLDGDHRYKNFKVDVQSWLPKLKEGGIICGHDCEGYYEDYPERMRDKIDRSLSEDYVADVGHPGVIKGLYEIFKKEYLKMPNSRIWYYLKKGKAL